MNTLGTLYLSGNGVTQDFNKAYQLFLDSAQEKFATAMANLGDMYMYGLGRSADATKAVMWYQRAVDNGSHHTDQMLQEAKKMMKKEQEIASEIDKEEDENLTPRERIERKLPPEGNLPILVVLISQLLKP